ncbi:3-ketoacyl-CoA synthase [Vigna angularis]|uniref:3-ketoacyl-CoA synthase n=1 Tax=Phaseolus angularis TaxID=3914 RepID=A0A8T0KSW9_PHAAN|nr:3-ketoacyl-CoA synthase [Vigna angularis]
MIEKRPSTSIYLLDFSCYRPPNHLIVHFQKFIHHSTLIGDFLPPHHAREEAEQVMFGALDNLFANTRVKPKDIRILVVNPTPSLSCFTLSLFLSLNFRLPSFLFYLVVEEKPEKGLEKIRVLTYTLLVMDSYCHSTVDLIRLESEFDTRSVVKRKINLGCEKRAQIVQEIDEACRSQGQDRNQQYTILYPQFSLLFQLHGTHLLFSLAMSTIT